MAEDHRVNHSRLSHSRTFSRSTVSHYSTLLTEDEKTVVNETLYQSAVLPRRVAQPSPKIGDRHYNRMKYYSSLKTSAMIEEGKGGGEKLVEEVADEQQRRDLQNWLDIPEHMLQINESAFVPSYGGRYII